MVEIRIYTSYLKKRPSTAFPYFFHQDPGQSQGMCTVKNAIQEALAKINNTTTPQSVEIEIYIL